MTQELAGLADTELVKLAGSGRLPAYEMLVRRYQKLVYNLLYQMVGGHETAADLTQETFLKAFAALPSFKSELSFKPWLLRIATNNARNCIRRSKPSDSLDAWLDENPQQEPAGAYNVEAQVEAAFSQALIADALAELNARQRHVFLLRYQQELSYEEISEIIGEPLTTIKPLLFRIRQRLRSILVSRGIRENE